MVIFSILERFIVIKYVIKHGRPPLTQEFALEMGSNGIELPSYERQSEDFKLVTVVLLLLCSSKNLINSVIFRILECFMVMKYFIRQRDPSASCRPAPPGRSAGNRPGRPP